MRPGFIVPSESRQHRTVVGMGIRVVGFDYQRGLELCFRLCELVLRGPGFAQVDERFGVARIEF
jgi:hypothetical protein